MFQISQPLISQTSQVQHHGQSFQYQKATVFFICTHTLLFSKVLKDYFISDFSPHSSSPTPPLLLLSVDNFISYFKEKPPSICVQYFITLLIYYGWTDNPELLEIIAQILKILPSHWSDSFFLTFKVRTHIPCPPILAFIFLLLFFLFFFIIILKSCHLKISILPSRFSYLSSLFGFGALGHSSLF